MTYRRCVRSAGTKLVDPMFLCASLSAAVLSVSLNQRKNCATVEWEVRSQNGKRPTSPIAGRIS